MWTRSAHACTRSRNAALPELAGKTAIVTGAAWGIGRATTLALVAAGAQVVATDLEEEREGLDEVVGLGEGAVTRCVADVASEADWRRVVETAGEVDLLVNNAGGHEPPNFPDTTSDRWGAVLDVNLRGAMLGIQAVLEPMRRRGGGSIVNVSSVAGLVRAPYRPVEYAAAKAGLIAVTTSLGSLWESDRISVTCIAPDWVLTEAVERTVAAMTPEQRAERVPGLVPVEEIAGLILRLATEETLAGRVMVRWADEDGERLLPLGRE
jgi:NAD(P)-dependent dehydrogenase (short-subunit alcohol dehydrogenase family)